MRTTFDRPVGPNRENHRRPTGRGLLGACVGAMLVLGCSGSSSPDNGVGNEINSTGGAISSGGANGVGGVSIGAGGVMTGGATQTGGSNAAGGARPATGGAMTGGATPLGGTRATGGTNASGGSRNTSPATTGGSNAAGGVFSTGGLPATGGAGATNATGGKASTGGTVATGGATAAAGSKSTGGTSTHGSTGGAATTGGATAGGSSGTGPCDIYAAANIPCVAAHSVVRALFAAYDGYLYQVRRASDKTTKDIPLLAKGGYVDSSVQDSFCTGTTCTISYIYDQSSLKNDLPLSPPVHWLSNGGTEASATLGKATVGGHTVYGVYVQSDVGNTYRNNKTKGVATGDQPEAIYMVVDGKRYNNRCCFDYGNVETTGNDDGSATMEALEWGNLELSSWGTGNGPWVMADLENGVFGGAGSGVVSSNKPIVANYATLMLKGSSGNRFALKGGDASGPLSTMWDGARPTGYSPMKKEGAVELGVGGDGSAGGIGTFFEGAVTSGNPPDATDDAVQANIVAAGYGH